MHENDKSAKRIQTEVSILKNTHHPNIIPLHDVVDTNESLYLVMELVTGGELFDKIVEKKSYSEKDACTVVTHILNAILYLHQINIAHRDLKPENLLIKSSNDDTHVMISDFGLSRVLGQNSMAYTACGTPYYVAPEVLSEKGYNTQVDLWSIGVITYFLLAGFPPFMGDAFIEVVEQILAADFEFDPEYWKDISDEAKDFVSKLLVTDPDVRMTATQALQHSWIKNGSNGVKPLQNSQLQQRAQHIRRMMSTTSLKSGDNN